MSMESRILTFSLLVTILLVWIPELVQTQTVTFDAPLDGYSVEESTGSIQICVIVSGAVSTSFTITLSTTAGSAQEFLDFTPVTESFTFMRSSGTTDCATISIMQDAILESGEFFLVSLTSSSSSIVLPVPRLITIIDSNNVVLDFQSPTFSTTEDTAAEVCVVIQAGMIARPVAFSVTPSDGTATASGQDFAPISIDRTFASNSDSPKCFSMTVNEDTIVESDETFVITLSSPDTPTDRIGTVIIHDNDGVSIALSSSSLSVIEGNTGTTSLPLCVQLQNIMMGLDRSVPLLLNTTFGTADANDFLALANEEFIIPSSSPLNQDVCFDLTLNGDVIRESDETFTVTVTVGNSIDVIVGSNTVTVTILDDNDVIADCMSLSSPQNGDVQFTSTLQGSVATYSCIVGYTVVGPSNRTCLSSGLWSDNDPTCELVDCESLSDPNNGVVNDPVTTYQSVATYQCNTGYNRIGESSRTCQADGNWSGQEPICQIVNCGELSDPENGQVTFSSTVYQSQAVYSCNNGYELSQTGSVQRICRASGVWSSFAPQCNPVDCGTLLSPDNGTISLTGTTFTNTATYSCSVGYTLINGDQIRECEPDGTWSGTQPMCQVDCGELASPPNGTISYTSGTLLGSIAMYSCDLGYDLVGGDALRTCGSDGDWSGIKPTGCQPRDCGNPGVPDNGQVSLSAGTTLGSIATYSCDLGHDLIGESVRECGTDGQWTNSVPTCMIIDCGSLSPPNDGTVQLTGTVFGSQATYSCNVGYTLVGVNMRTCLASQNWSGVAPTCEIVDCGAPNNPENGDVTFTLTVYNAFAIYSCEEGYNLVPSETFRTCEADGNWSGDDRACQPVDCGTRSNPTNGQFNALQTTLGSVAMYTCNAGYDLIGQENITCQPNGEWSSSPPNCMAVECGSLDSPANGNVSLSGTTFQSVAQYSCDLGYILVGVESRQCQANQTWSGESPVCEAVDCDGLNNPDNGEVSLSGTRLNSVATYACNIGYDLVGDTERRCTEVGQWSGNQPVCRIVQCIEVLSSPTNGNLVITGNTYLSEAQYSCLEGFAVVGPTVRVCQDDGQWSGSQPHCEENMCPDLESLENGVIRITEVGFEAGLLATYECNEGYTISSPVDATRICQLSGEWTGTAPMCIINDCGADPPTPDNGVVLTSGTTFGSQARYFCNDGYEVHPSGGEIRTCLANESWSGVDPTCEPIDCGMLGNPPNGDAITNSTTLGSLASYSCRAGYELEGDAVRVCQPNRSWSNNEPACLDIDECQGDHGCDQECVNDIGGFHCECRTGYQLVDTFSCADINECIDSNGGCAQVCNNTVGSFLCGCNDGYLLNTDGINCDDINECQGDHGCDQECVNDIGGFHCECRTGYQLVDTFICRDVDECVDSNGRCAQVCNNTVGSFICGCTEGYLLNSDGIGCDDVDECALELNGCHGNATCLNTNGSFNCLCDDGYDGDGFLCTDIDECLEGRHTCDSKAICNNTNGGFECACLPGYEGDGFICDNINECEVGTHNCHEDAECIDSEGSFSCVCKLGFSGDGVSCERQCVTIFQLLLNGVKNCQQWRLESTEEKLLDIQRILLQELLQRCPTCEISHIADGEFSCPIGPDSSDVLYRAQLYGLQHDNCLELITAVTNWVQSSQTSLLVQNSRLQVAQNCMVEINSFQSDLDCPIPTTEAEGVRPGASVGSGTVIGAAAGVAGAIFLITVMVVIIAIAVILKKKKQKRFTLPSHLVFIEPDQAYSSLTHPSTPLQESNQSQRRHQNDYEEGNVIETSTFNPDGNVLPTLGRTLSDRRQHRIQSPYAEIGEAMVGNGKVQHDEFYEKVYDDGYHFDVEEVYDKAQSLPTDYETMEKAVADNPLYDKVESQ